MAGVVLLVFWKMKGKDWGIALSLGSLSHWFLDALVHLSDMPLLHNGLKVGLGLWQYPWIAFLLELSALLLAGLFLLKDHGRKGRIAILMLCLTLGFVGMFFAPEAEASPAAASVMSLSLYAIFTAMAFWADRKVREQEIGNA